ncbi:MAG: hypothetical protein L3J54_13270, partial [Draconibacterium sp.]|nr:hypothetical protein [Draconibacterium sp.]
LLLIVLILILIFSNMTKKIVIINGNPETGENKLNLFLSETANKLNNDGFAVIQNIPKLLLF